MAIYFLFDLSIRTLEVTTISVDNFLITCLVSEILKDKDTNHTPSWIFKKTMTSQVGEYFFLLEAISKYVQC